MDTAARRYERPFVLFLAALLVTIVFVGFARTYYLKRLFGTPPLSLLLHLFTAWLVLLTVQRTLVAARCTDLHLRLGVLGGVLAVLMVLAGSGAAAESARRGFAPPGGLPPLVFLIVPLGHLAVFATLVATALYFRRMRDAHKRLMLLASIAILTPAIARLPVVAPLGVPV